MAVLSGILAPYDFSAATTDVDVGGSHGGLLAALLHAPLWVSYHYPESLFWIRRAGAGGAGRIIRYMAAISTSF
jgi:hypothetical protein